MDYNKLPRENGKYIKLGNGKVEHTETLPNGTPNYTYTLTHNLCAKVVDMQNEVLCEEIVSFAKKQGITDLFLIDEDFVKSALMHEKARRERQSIKPKTNFDRITENEGALANFIRSRVVCAVCPVINCSLYNTKNAKNEDCLQSIKEWLQKECEE